MVSRRVKRLKKLLKVLDGKAELNLNKGPLIHDWRSHRLNSRKDKKRKGHKSGQIIHPKMKWKEVHEEALDGAEYWDSWCEYRDGQRDFVSDATRFKRKPIYADFYPFFPDVNKKLRRELEIRRAIKAKRKYER